MTKKLVIVLMLLGVSGGLSFAGPKNGPKIADDLDLTSRAPVDVIITYAKPPGFLDNLLLGLLNTVSTLLGSVVHVILPGTQLTTVASSSNVVYIAPNRTVHPT